jgi:hypothetical protein
MATYQSSGNGTAHKGPVGERVDHLSGSAQQFFNDARGAVSDLNGYLDLKGRVHRHPYGMLAAAAGIGYLLGGGLFSPLTGRMVQLGIRLAALPFVKDELLAIAQNTLDALGASNEGAPEVSNPIPQH